MPAFFDGKAVAAEIEADLQLRTEHLPRAPRLGIVLASEDPASASYVGAKVKAAERVGIDVQFAQLGMNPDFDAVAGEIRRLAGEVDGLILQLPLPKRLESRREELLALIPEELDIDGFGENSSFAPPVGLAVLRALQLAPAGWEDAPVALLGFGRTGGRAIARVFDEFLENEEKPELLIGTAEDPLDAEELAAAKMIVSAVGIPGIFDTNLEGKWLVQVGAARDDEGEIRGDFTADAVESAKWATPLRGGIGPLTAIYLLANVVRAADER